MKLSHVYLYFRDELDDFEVTFNNHVNFINWYISKSIRKFKIDLPYDFNALGVRPTLTGTDSCTIVPVKWLDISLSLKDEEKQQYLKLISPNDKCEFYLSLLERGYRIANKSFEIPVDILLSIHEEFRKNNYTTEWIFKNVYIKELGINVVLRCQLTAYDFSFYMDVLKHKSKECITSVLIWQTPPHYLCFHKDIRKLELKDGKILVLDFLDRPHFEMDISSLVTDQPIINYIYGNKVEEPQVIQKLRQEFSIGHLSI